MFDGTIYHMFPLGLLGADRSFVGQDPVPPDDPRNIRRVADWIPHLQYLGVEAVLFGPIFASQTHGYDTIDLFRIDPRLGTESDFLALVGLLHREGISVLVDAVFNHVGRGFFAFQDILRNRVNSPYRDWFSGLQFSEEGYSDLGPEGISYDTWDGHGALVKLDTRCPDVREYLLGAATHWIEDLGVDGLRLDAADVIDGAFWPVLRERVDSRYRRDLPFGGGRFWLNGEMVHGEYDTLCGSDRLDGTTNFEVYKGLWSSHNDRNYHEIAHSLQRQFGDGGVYRGTKLLTFADNHDVSRIASALEEPRHLYPLHILLFTIPGTPAIYYGSETGIHGEKGPPDDWNLRPPLSPRVIAEEGPHPDLISTIAKLSALRSQLTVLGDDALTIVHTSAQQIAFLRGSVVVAVNAADHEESIAVPPGAYEDRLNGTKPFTATNSEPAVPVPPYWGRVLVPLT